MHAVIDGDIICYSVGFASEHRSYVVDGVSFDYKKEALAFCEETGASTDAIKAVIDPEPIEYALSSVKRMIANICKAAQCEDYTVFLTGGSNFRDEVATIAPYKGNREDSTKPEHYSAIKEYLIEVHHAVVVEGQEADDAMAIAACQRPDEVVICTIDKDLDGVPGMHYNWKHDALYCVEEDEADRFFYTQLLTGDSTDNIPGLFKMTGVRATAKVKDIINYLDEPEHMYKYVRRVYLSAYEKVGMCLDEADEVVDRWLLEIGRLLWMRREPNQMWVPPTKESTSANT